MVPATVLVPLCLQSLFSCAVYSIATNYTFKWPVLAGAVACLLSNIMCAHDPPFVAIELLTS